MPLGKSFTLLHVPTAMPWTSCPGTLASVPANYLALKPAKSSSKCIFLWLLWVLFCKALLLLTTTAHLSTVRQRLSHQKSAVQLLRDAPRLWQIIRCLIRCDNMLLCELYIQHCTEIAPCHAVFALGSGHLVPSTRLVTCPGLSCSAEPESPHSRKKFLLSHVGQVIAFQVIFTALFRQQVPRGRQ